MDGTLLDSMGVWENIGEDYLRRCGIEPPEDLTESIKAMTLPQCARYFCQRFSLPHTPEEIIAQVGEMVGDLYRSQLPLKAGVLPLLEKLHSQGVAMCVATASGRDLALPALERTGVLKYMQFVLTVDEVGIRKDTPEFFRKVLERLGTPLEKTVVFEDALHAIEGAKAAGFSVVGVYDSSMEKYQAQIASLADRYFTSLEEWKEVDL